MHQSIEEKYFKEKRERREETGKIFREEWGWRGVKIIEAEISLDHIHMLEEIPPPLRANPTSDFTDNASKMRVSGLKGFLKGKSSLIIQEGQANLKYKPGNDYL